MPTPLDPSATTDWEARKAAAKAHERAEAERRQREAADADLRRQLERHGVGLRGRLMLERAVADLVAVYATAEAV